MMSLTTILANSARALLRPRPSGFAHGGNHRDGALASRGTTATQALFEVHIPRQLR